MMSSRGRPQLGFTLIELMAVVALGAVVLAIAVPSFTGMLAKKKVESIAAELGTDLQYARSEAVRRNVPVRIIVGSNCYVIHTAGSTPATSCASLGTGATSLKSFTIDTGAATTFTFTSNNSKAFLEFDPVRGMAVDSSGSDYSGYITVGTTGGAWQMRADVNQFGRAKTCSPGGTIAGIPSCS